MYVSGYMLDDLYTSSTPIMTDTITIIITIIVVVVILHMRKLRLPKAKTFGQPCGNK